MNSTNALSLRVGSTWGGPLVTPKVAGVESYTPSTTNPHVKTKSMLFRPLIYLDSHSFLGVRQGNERSEDHRSGLGVRVGGDRVFPSPVPRIGHFWSLDYLEK